MADSVLLRIKISSIFPRHGSERILLVLLIKLDCKMGGWHGIDCTGDKRGRFAPIEMMAHYKSQQMGEGRTVLVLIKLTKFAVALRLRCGSCKLIFDIISLFFA